MKNNKDELHRLFAQGCPPAREDAAFKARVLERVKSDTHRRSSRSFGEKLTEFLLSPLPLVFAASLLMIVFRNRLFSLVNTSSREWLFVAVCLGALLVAVAIVYCFSEEKNQIDIDKIRKELERSKQ